MIADRDKILRRVRGLKARAQHHSTPTHEAASARAKADELVRKYALADLPAPEAPRPAATVARATVVHLMNGFTPAGARWRAWCRCGHRTTPRASYDRALRALAATHPLDVPECVLCGATYEDADWMAVRDRHLQVLDDPVLGAFAVCRDVQQCLARS